jgi:hypothetical protein
VSQTERNQIVGLDQGRASGGDEIKALGNFPQAFTHIGLISAAFNLDLDIEGVGRAVLNEEKAGVGVICSSHSARTNSVAGDAAKPTANNRNRARNGNFWTGDRGSKSPHFGKRSYG